MSRVEIKPCRRLPTVFVEHPPPFRYDVSQFLITDSLGVGTPLHCRMRPRMMRGIPRENDMFNKEIVGAAVLAGALALPMAASTSAQGPVVTGGLVNVTITDVIDDVTVNVEDVSLTVAAALQLAANVCDVGVNVLATQLKSGGATCSAVVDGTGQIITITQ